MKKLAFVLMALVMSMIIACTAFATTCTFAMTTVTDTEGNILATLTEDGIVVDANGNDISDQFPVLVFALNDETMECTFATNDAEPLSGTAEVTEEAEEGSVLTITLEDGEVFEIVYTVTEDGLVSCTYVDAENSLLFIMPAIEIAE